MIETLAKTTLASPRRTLALTALVAVLALAAVDPAAAGCSGVPNDDPACIMP